ncbi:glycerate kinase, partial [Streptomyces hydrogenans]|uniref:glycerate kinase n=1 Tax=Streptomyces hydrogenans TaxID=1873719 RepID=UPI0036451702
VLERLVDRTPGPDWLAHYATALAGLHASAPADLDDLAGTAPATALPTWTGPTGRDLGCFIALARALDVPALERATLVITGEGSLDEQTLHGKAPAGVAAAARAAGKEVVAVCGRLALPPETLGAAGIRRAYPLSALEPDPAKSIPNAGPLLEEVASHIARDFLA